MTSHLQDLQSTCNDVLQRPAIDLQTKNTNRNGQTATTCNRTCNKTCKTCTGSLEPRAVAGWDSRKCRTYAQKRKPQNVAAALSPRSDSRSRLRVSLRSQASLSKDPHFQAVVSPCASDHQPQARTSQASNPAPSQPSLNVSETRQRTRPRAARTASFLTRCLRSPHVEA